MNVSNVTELYYYIDQTNDRVTYNLTLTSSVTLTPETYDSGNALHNREVLSTPTHGERSIYNQA